MIELTLGALCVISIISAVIWWLDAREAKEEEVAYRKMRQEDEGFEVVEPRP